MTPDLMTIASIGIVILAFLALAAVAMFTFTKRKPAAPPPPMQTYDPRPYSLSRAIDDAKHEAADVLIRTTLGNAHAVSMGKVLAGMEAKPAGPNP
jgi:hypothetical protein